MKVRRIDFSPDEWLSGTVELSPEDRGVYITICALIYSRGGPIDIDVLRGHTRTHGNRLNAIVDRLARLRKILRNGPEIDQKRCRNELEKAEKRIRKARENGAKGGRPNGLGKPDGLQSDKTNHQPSTINSSSVPKGTAASAASSDPIKRMWEDGIAILGGNRSLLGKLIKDHGQVAVIEAIDATNEARAPDAASYLIGCLRRRKSNGTGELGFTIGVG